MKQKSEHSALVKDLRNYSKFHSNNNIVKKRQRMVILQRYTDVENRFHINGVREWSNHTYESVISAFQLYFHNHDVIRLSSVCALSGTCSIIQDIVEYTQADVLIAIHGAGMMNQIFMPPGSLIVEISGEFSLACSPGGYYGGVASVFGHHHCLWYYVDKRHELISEEKISEETYHYYRLQPKLVAKKAWLMYKHIKRLAVLQDRLGDEI